MHINDQGKSDSNDCIARLWSTSEGIGLGGCEEAAMYSSGTKIELNRNQEETCLLLLNTLASSFPDVADNNKMPHLRGCSCLKMRQSLVHLLYEQD
jgi:hypothetical protein